MGNDKLLLSMMVGACVFLLVGIVVTVVEVMGYTGEVEVPTAAAPAGGAGQAQQQQQDAGQQQAPAGGAGAGPGTKVQLLAQAPQNAVGIATVNMARLRSLGIGQGQQGGMAGQMVNTQAPVNPDKLEQLVALALSDAENPDAPPTTGAVVKHSASASEVTSSLQQQGTAGEAVQGMDTYQMPQQGVVAIADDQTLLVAQTASGLEQLATLYTQQQDALSQLLQQEGSAIKFEAKITDQMRSQMMQESGQMMPGWGKTLMQELTHAAGEVDMSQQGLKFNADLTMSGQQAAGQIADQLNQKLTETKDKLTQMLQQQVQSMQNMGGTGGQAQQQMQQMQSALDTLPAAFDKINISSTGADLSLGAQFTTEELKSLGQAAQMLIMQAMMQQGFGGGGQGGFGGPGMPGAPQ